MESYQFQIHTAGQQPLRTLAEKQCAPCSVWQTLRGPSASLQLHCRRPEQAQHVRSGALHAVRPGACERVGPRQRLWTAGVTGVG